MSEIRSILLHLDAADTLGARLRLAQRLALAHGARVDALYAVMPAVLQNPFAFTVDMAGANLLIECEAEQRERVKAAFERERAQLGADASRFAWHHTADEPVRGFTQHAWAADLLLLAQHDPTAKLPSGVPADFVQAVLLESGKPGLVMPFIGAGAEVGSKVLLAWKPTPESTRAVTAALPLLQRAREVHLAVWDEAGRGEDAAAAIEPYLRQHGVAATVHRGGAPSRELGELLLSLAADLGADLLVMGCYGHGRAREWVLGGATRTVLRSMTLPVLMVH